MIKKEIDHLIYFFEEQILLFKDQARRTFHKPSIKHVHDLRVTVRRLRVVLWILGQVSSDKKLKNLLGEQRDMDVLISKAKPFPDLNVPNKVVNPRFKTQQQMQNEGTQMNPNTNSTGLPIP